LLVPDNQRRSSGLLIPIILIVGLAGAVSFGWWWRARAKLPFEPMPAGTPTKVAQLVEQGDRLYLGAMAHLNNSDARLNPFWAAENRKALDLFKKSRDSYAPAQDEYTGGLSPPSPLIDRIREASMQCFFCRKRLIAAERR
jgi:hypothetical protein